MISETFTPLFVWENLNGEKVSLTAIRPAYPSFSMKFLSLPLILASIVSFSPLVSPLVAESPQDNPAIKPENRMKEDWWAKRWERNLATAKEGKAKLVFLGDSITQGWEGGGKKMWEEKWAPYAAANFGYSGDRTEHVLWRIENGEFDG
jgi:hypothetical protein